MRSLCVTLTLGSSCPNLLAVGYIDYNEKHACESNGFNLDPKYCK